MPVHEDVNQAISLITEATKKQKPFFINLWMHEPHTPFHVLPKYRWWFQDLDDADNIYAATLAHADDRIGRLLNALDENGLTEKTLVIFSSDNGPARAANPTELELSYDTATGAGFGIGASKGITGGRKGYKAALFEGGICVPFIARWPNKIPAGAIDDQTLISAVDLLPTFCEFAGATMPEEYVPDGVSQVSALCGKSTPARKTPLFWKASSPWPAPKNRPYHWGSYAVVDGPWKLISNADLSHVELYAITEDQKESTDCAAEHPEVVNLLKRRIQEWQQTLPLKPEGPVFSTGRTRER
jgi:N-acetylgalactosamine-6-sulfatase